MKTKQRNHSHRRLITSVLLAGIGLPAIAADRDLSKPTRLPSVLTESASSQSASPMTTPPINTGVRNASSNTDARHQRLPAAQSQADDAMAVPTRWLRSTTSNASSEAARRMIAQATAEYNSHAWMSAETSAWEAIRHASAAVDLSTQEHGYAIAGSTPTAAKHFTMAKQAIIEARDFAGSYGPVDDAAIRRIARGHSSGLIRLDSTQTLKANEATDQYLDFARTNLAVVAKASTDAAQAMDLLAAIYLERADSKTIPSGTALCLRRAALQGQPNNPSLASRLGMHLADIGLNDEARWALEHSLSFEYDPPTAQALVAVMRSTGDAAAANQWIAKLDSAADASSGQIKIPEVVELSPTEFASVSKPVMPRPANTRMVPGKLASAKVNRTGETPDTIQPFAPEPSMVDANDIDPAKKPSIIRRFLGVFKNPW
ncbi:hypothetical protein Poly51_46120 [Rubripirellula tenax]|uniref:Tetratricopeptide repeat protein n=1 Tax=Rubripirellula tenax TaxID=2528015 RepID=A0A5C6EJM3_9BACT|nr:hypothetical protein [Rubripirellula tenax]TWU48710.1 hypothetical protein Poly51_46120 [Rubripirellula tenax]